MTVNLLTRTWHTEKLIILAMMISTTISCKLARHHPENLSDINISVAMKLRSHIESGKSRMHACQLGEYLWPVINDFVNMFVVIMAI